MTSLQCVVALVALELLGAKRCRTLLKCPHSPASSGKQFPAQIPKPSCLRPCGHTDSCRSRLTALCLRGPGGNAGRGSLERRGVEGRAQALGPDLDV